MTELAAGSAETDRMAFSRWSQSVRSAIPRKVGADCFSVVIVDVAYQVAARLPQLWLSHWAANVQTISLACSQNYSHVRFRLFTRQLRYWQIEAYEVRVLVASRWNSRRTGKWKSQERCTVEPGRDWSDFGSRRCKISRPLLPQSV